MVHNEKQKARTEATSRYANGGGECDDGGADVLHAEVLVNLSAEGDDARGDGYVSAQPSDGAGVDGVYGDGGGGAVKLYQPRLLFPDVDGGVGLAAWLCQAKSHLLSDLQRVEHGDGDALGVGAGASAGGQGDDSADAVRKTGDPDPCLRGPQAHLWHRSVSVGSYLFAWRPFPYTFAQTSLPIVHRWV